MSDDGLLTEVNRRLDKLEGLMSMPEGQDESLYGVVRRLDGQAKTDDALERSLHELGKRVRELEDSTIRREDAEEVATQVRDEAIPEEIWHRLRECEDRLCKMEKGRDQTEHWADTINKQLWAAQERLTVAEDQAGGALQRVSELERKLPAELIPVGRNEFEEEVGAIRAELRGAAEDSLDDRFKALERQVEIVLDRISRTQHDMHEAKTKTRRRFKELESQQREFAGFVEGVPWVQIERKVEALVALEANRGKMAADKIEPVHEKRFGPLERVHLVELELPMSLVKPQNWPIKEFWGFVTVHSEPRRENGEYLELEGAAIDAAGTRDFMVRPFAVLGQRWAGVGSFTSETMNRYWGEGRAELRVTEWRRTDRTDDGKVLAKKLEGNP